MVHVKKAERNKLLFTLLMDGVLTVKKEFHGAHPDTLVDNLKVWMLLRSLHSKGYVDVVFSWLVNKETLLLYSEQHWNRLHQGQARNH